MANPNPDQSGLEKGRWKKGQSGNPKGKPKGVTHSSTRLKRLLELTENLTNPITKEIEGFTVAEQLDLAQIIKARKGDTRAYNAILDRLEGKPNQSIEHTGDNTNPISMILDQYGGGKGKGIDELPTTEKGSSKDSA